MCSDAYVGSGSEDCSVYFWDLVEGSVAHCVKNAHSKAVVSLSYSRTTNSLMTSSLDGTAKLFVAPEEDVEGVEEE